MKILMINKFLFPNGGSETYMFKLGETLMAHGHEVQYFGMEHEGRCVGNAVESYTSDMDFHSSSVISNLSYLVKTIYSSESRKKIRLVLEDFKPDVCHLNNFNYQLTPSIILEIRKWERQTKHKVRIVYTAHDYQLICPNHMLYNPNTKKNCDKCIKGSFVNCIREKCIHGSTLKSIVGAIEATVWNLNGVYKQIDNIICCSNFMKKIMDAIPSFASKNIVMHNFTDFQAEGLVEKEDYILYYGRYTEEKGVRTLIKVCKLLPNIQFVFAGTGPLEEELKAVKNIRDVGFQIGSSLKEYIQKAKMTICPSEWFEPFGLTVIESIKLGTPVIGAQMGGLSESIEKGKNGDLFESGNVQEIVDMILYYWNNTEDLQNLTKQCQQFECNDSEDYANKLLEIYRGGVRVMVNYKIPYVLYFGRFSEEKGIKTLMSVCKDMSNVKFVFAGTGPLEKEIGEIPNIINVGFQKGKSLVELICGARLSVYPSEWYENCPYSVMESQMLGIPVLGARIGGIPELIDDGQNGITFESGNVNDLKEKLQYMLSMTFDHKQIAHQAHETYNAETYYKRIMEIYNKQI